MVKHVYYKKQATGCAWHLLSKMEKQIHLSIRRERERKRKAQSRKEQLMNAYINTRHPLVYKEAEQYYVRLNEKYPDKIDLRKTSRFKELAKIHITTVKDNMRLDIPMVAKPVAEVPPAQNTQIVEECVLPLDLETIDGIVEDMLPEDVLQGIMNDLQQDPCIRQAMEEIEALVGCESEEDIDIDIEIDDRLEKELQQW